MKNPLNEIILEENKIRFYQNSMLHRKNGPAVINIEKNVLYIVWYKRGLGSPDK